MTTSSESWRQPRETKIGQKSSPAYIPPRLQIRWSNHQDGVPHAKPCSILKKTAPYNPKPKRGDMPLHPHLQNGLRHLAVSPFHAGNGTDVTSHAHMGKHVVSSTSVPDAENQTTRSAIVPAKRPSNDSHIANLNHTHGPHLSLHLPCVLCPFIYPYFS